LRNVFLTKQLPGFREFVEFIYTLLLNNPDSLESGKELMDEQWQSEDIPTPADDAEASGGPFVGGTAVIKVSAKSRSTAVAGAIAGMLRDHRHAEVQAIGAGAVNQAVKAVAIARGYLQGDSIDLICIPYFTDVEIDGQERTAVRFIVEPR